MGRGWPSGDDGSVLALMSATRTQGTRCALHGHGRRCLGKKPIQTWSGGAREIRQVVWGVCLGPRQSSSWIARAGSGLGLAPGPGPPGRPAAQPAPLHPKPLSKRPRNRHRAPSSRHPLSPRPWCFQIFSHIEQVGDEPSAISPYHPFPYLLVPRRQAKKTEEPP